MIANKKIVAGLTGGIASGKSVAAEMFERAGAYIINTDAVARRVSESGEGYEKMKAAFSEAYEHGILNRGKLREIVFADSNKLSLLNSVTHPLILERTRAEIEAADSAVIIVEAPLLFEAGFDAITDYDIAVTCPESTRIERLVKRDNISKELALNMIRAQMTDAERAERADAVIENDGSLARLRAQVMRVYLELTEKAKR